MKAKPINEASLLLEQHLTESFGSTRLFAEYRFAPPRKWRFDFCVPTYRIAFELEGAIWANGRHNRGKGYQGDLDKYNQAAALGWKVFRFSTEDVLTGRDLAYLKQEQV